MFPAGSPVFDDLRFLLRESGRSFTSLTPPLSSGEITLILDCIDQDALSPASRNAYKRIQEALNPAMLLSKDFFSLSAHIAVGAEARVRTNPNLPWMQPYKNSPALVNIQIGMFFADFLQLYIEPSVSHDPDSYNEGPYFGTNIIYKAKHMDMNMPLRGFVAAGGPWWSFELGRDRVSFGSAHTGNLAISDTPDYYDMGRLSLFASFFKYSLLVSQMPLNRDELIIEGYPHDPDQPELPINALHSTTQRYLYVHRFDVNLFGRVAIGVTEGLMVGNSAVELRYLNPTSIFHSFFSWFDYDEWGNIPEWGDMTGSLFAVDADWTIIPSLAVYGQFIMNQAATPGEAEGYPDNQAPSAFGYLLGTELTRDFAGWQANLYAEWVYGDPYLYTLSSPFASYIWMRRLSPGGKEHSMRYTWIGHPEGRDMMLFALGASASKDKWAFSAGFSYIMRGEHTIRWDWNMGRGYTDQKTPSGTPEHTLKGMFGAQWKPLSFLTVSGQIGGTVKAINADHIRGARKYGMDATLGVQFLY